MDDHRSRKQPNDRRVPSALFDDEDGADLPALRKIPLGLLRNPLSSPRAVASSPSAMPGATTARLVVWAFEIPMKLSLLPRGEGSSQR
jgi:hypothetical protein